MIKSDAARGIRFLCAGVFVFSLQDAVVKQVSGDYPLTEVMAIRSMVAIPILLVIVQLEAGWRAIFTPHFRSLTARAGLMFGAYTSYYMAFPAMNLAYAVALYFTVPLFVTALAGPVLGERIGAKVWAALAVGFSGIVVILQPGSGLFEWAALLSLTSALMYASSMLMARRIGIAQPASVMTFYQNWVFLAGALVIAACTHWLGIKDAGHPSITFLVRPWVWPSLGDALLIASCGVIASAGMLFLTNAYRIAPANLVTPFEYTGILWAPLWGYLFFGEVPRSTTVFGAMLIVAAGIVALGEARK
ncbi:MAG: DMT family transporter [Burkholderiaceae bacterium]